MFVRHAALPQLRCLTLILFFCLAFALSLRAQITDRTERAAQWDAYTPPAEEWKRVLDRQKGYAFWVPPAWQETSDKDGRVWMPTEGGINLFVLTEEIPEGLGLANYANASLQGLRGQRLRPDSLVMRPVWLNGLEWRELSYELEPQPGVYVHQTMWLTAHQARAYGFACAFQPTEQAQREPLFKRILQSVRILKASPWDEEFETLRAGMTVNAPASEIKAAQLADDVRSARASQATLSSRLLALFEQAPAAALDLLTDATPHVRTVAITALGQRAAQTKSALELNALRWALKDKDTMASTAAAQALASVVSAAPNGWAVLHPHLPSLAESPAALVRLGTALEPPHARTLLEELLRSENPKAQLAALQLALSQAQLTVTLPYARLFAATDAQVLHSLVAVLQRQRPADALTELTKLLRAENEPWAARALAILAPKEVATRLEARIAEIDKRLGTVAVAPNQTPKKRRGIEVIGHSMPLNPTLPTPSDLKTKPEEVRLALARGELVAAVAKIKLRDRWQQAKDEAARRALLAETDKEVFTLAEWARTALPITETASTAAPTFDLTKLKDTPSTGETLFPASTISYVQAPNFAASLEKLDQALAGVQMATVRDQMTLALFLNVIKANLAAKFGAVETPNPGAALGLELQTPVALGAWPAAHGASNAPIRSGITLRVTDRARFERLLALYQEDYGSLDSLAIGAPLIARAAGLLPAVLPVIFGALVAESVPSILPATGRTAPLVLSSSPVFSYVRQERLGELPVTVFEKQRLSAADTPVTEALFVAYLGQTALVASSRAALLDALQAATTPATALGQSAAFAQLRREQGELVFFSQPGAVLKQVAALAPTPNSTEDELAALSSVLGTESGALQLSASAWETVFNLSLADNQLSRTFKVFNVESLAAPRELLPQGTILYAGAIVDPPALLEALKSLAKPNAAKPQASTPGKMPEQLARARALDEDIEKLIVPNLHGELAAALVSLQPLFNAELSKGSNGWPAMIFAAKLKNKELSALHQAGKLLAAYGRVPETKIFAAPVIALGDDNGAPFLVVNDYYLILADSIATLRLLEGQDSFAKTQDFQRSKQSVPEQVVFFATYNLNAAFEEARRAMQANKREELLPFISAVTHAFHSQRAYVTSTPAGLRGRLAVAFDREGRYAVGNLARPSGEFDVANALIVPKGLRVIHSPRLETLTLRATAQQPGIVPRVRDDLSKFAWQKIASSDEHALVFTSAARHIAPAQTLKLPVTGAEFTPFLNASSGIFPQAPEIAARAKEIAGKDTDGRSVARKLAAWTYANLKWKRVQSSTVETLASREADCLEHAELYVALARACGLPARVVTGAALGEGSFGAHAWVEVYLGQWCELDPTWGLLDYVDATHLRFEGNSFAEYAMLNQLELEITGARTTVAEYQRDPAQLLKAIGKHKDLSVTAFDLSVTAETALGPGAWDKLSDRQRHAAIQAFEITAARLTGPPQRFTQDDEEKDWPVTEVRLLRSEIQGPRATLLALREDDLLRFSLFARDGAWFISEIEDVDAALPYLADALHGALNPGEGHAQLNALEPEAALKRLDALLAAQGEQPELLLQKVRLLETQQTRQYFASLNAKALEQPDAKEPKPAEPPTAAKETKPDEILLLLQQIVARWPKFAPAQFALGRHSNLGAEENESQQQTRLTATLSQLKRYAEMVPEDPRPWLLLATNYRQLERLDEAEAAYRSAIEREPAHLNHRLWLLIFHLSHTQTDKARAVFGEMLKLSGPAAAFATLQADDDLPYDYSEALETMLLAFPKELAASVPGLHLLAQAQEAQEKYAAASKTMTRVLILQPDANGYSYQATLLRKQRRYAETVAAANQALKLAGDGDSIGAAYFERACARAQTGAKKLALADLQRLLETEAWMFFEDEDADLQPLAALPEFKALLEKLEQLRKPPEGEKK